MTAVRGTVIASILVAAGGLFIDTAHGHQAMPTDAQPSGWAYPPSCCGGDDCQAVPDRAIGEGPRGYIIRATGEVIGYADTRIKVSPDGVTHWCAAADTERTICLFIPPKGF
jgi:hypothetical protein